MSLQAAAAPAPAATLLHSTDERMQAETTINEEEENKRAARSPPEAAPNASSLQLRPLLLSRRPTSTDSTPTRSAWCSPSSTRATSSPLFVSQQWRAARLKRSAWPQLHLPTLIRALQDEDYDNPARRRLLIEKPSRLARLVSKPARLAMWRHVTDVKLVGTLSQRTDRRASVGSAAGGPALWLGAGAGALPRVGGGHAASVLRGGGSTEGPELVLRRASARALGCADEAARAGSEPPARRGGAESDGADPARVAAHGLPSEVPRPCRKLSLGHAVRALSVHHRLRSLSLHLQLPQQQHTLDA